MRNHENSITISTAGHGDHAKDYSGLRAALHRWEMKNGLRDSDGFIKNSLWKGKNRRNLFRRRPTTIQIQTTIPFRKTRKIPQHPKAGNELEKFPVMLRLDGHLVMVVIVGQFEMHLADFILQR